MNFQLTVVQIDIKPNQRNAALSIFNVLFDPILPVFTIMALGFFLGRTGKATVDDARLINRFAMTVFLPILLFGLIAQAPIHTFNITPVLVYAGVEGSLFVIGFILAFRLFNRPADESVLLAFCGVFANNAFFVLPISVLLYGAEHVLAITTIITLDATFTFAGVIIVLQVINLGKITPVSVALSIIKMPLIQAVVLGVFASLLRISIPDSIQTFLSFNGAAAAPLALFAIGIVLSGTKFSISPMILTFSTLKLAIFPLAIWGGLELMAPGNPERSLFLLGAAGPAGTVAFSLALLHGVKTDAIAQIVILTSILSLFSLAYLA